MTTITITTDGHDRRNEIDCLLSWCDGHELKEFEGFDSSELAHYSREIRLTMPVGSRTTHIHDGAPEIRLERTQSGDEGSLLRVTFDEVALTDDEAHPFVDFLRQVAAFLEVNGSRLLATKPAEEKES